MSASKARRVSGWIISLTLIGALVGNFAGRSAGGFVARRLRSQPNIKVLTQISEDVNSTLPVMLDEHTRADSSQVLSENAFAYNYTILGVGSLIREDLQDQFVAEFRPDLLARYKNAENMAFFRENDISVTFRYSDEAGRSFAEIEIRPTDIQ